MRTDHAPAVTYELASSKLHLAVFSGLTLLAGTSWAIWIRLSEQWVWTHLWSALVLALLWAWAFWAWARQPDQSLGWDGQNWSLNRGARMIPVVPSVVIDLQGHMLLHLSWQQPARGQSWAWPSAANQPERWLALRRALVASGKQ